MFASDPIKRLLRESLDSLGQFQLNVEMKVKLAHVQDTMSKSQTHWADTTIQLRLASEVDNSGSLKGAIACLCSKEPGIQ